MLTVFIAELKRRWSLAKAYPAEEIVGTVMMAMFFYMLFLGSQFMAGPTAQFGTRLDAVVVGYVVWILILHTYSGIASDLQSESTTGTLEQLMSSPYSLSRILLMRAMADVTVSVVLTSFVALLIMLLTGTRLYIASSMVLPVGAIVLGSTGLGFLIGSLVFLFKQIRSMQMVFQFLLLFAVMAPIENWSGAYTWLGAAIPLAPGAAALRSITIGQHFDLVMTLVGIANGVVYLLLGMYAFAKGEARAKKRGMVGHY